MPAMIGLTQCLVLVLFIPIVCSEEEDVLSTRTIDKINKGFTLAERIIDTINQKNFHETLSKITTFIGPILGMIGPFVGFLLSLTQSESPEMKYMKHMMKRIDTRFDQLDLRLNDMVRTIDWGPVRNKFGQIEQNIMAMSSEFRDLYKDAYSTAEQKRAHFIRRYDNDYKNSGYKLYLAVIYRGVFQENICESIMKYTKFDNNRTDHYMLGIEILLIEAAKIEITYLRLQNITSKEMFTKRKWEKRFKNIKATFELKKQVLIESYHRQSKYDTLEFATKYNGWTDDKFSTEFFRMLSEKYFWRDWFIGVFRKGYKYRVSVCGGHTFMNIPKRNIFIASVDKNVTAIDVDDAKGIMQSVTVWTRRCKLYGLTSCNDYTLSAANIYNSLDQPNGTCCVGVIEHASGLHYRHNKNSERFAYVRRGADYYLHMWG